MIKPQMKSEINRNLFQFWHEEGIPCEIEKLAQTFRSTNKDLQLHFHSRKTATEMFALHFTSKELNAFGECAVPAMAADYFRLGALLCKGGFYSDVDWINMRPLSDLIDKPTYALIFRRDKNGVFPNGMMYSTYPDHPLFRFALDMATWTIQQRLEVGVWFATGPAAITALDKFIFFNELNPKLIKPECYKDSNYNIPKNIQMRQWLDGLCHSIGSIGQAKSLFENVRIETFSSLSTFVMSPSELNYKFEKSHWLNWVGSIYNSKRVGV